MIRGPYGATPYGSLPYGAINLGEPQALLTGIGTMTVSFGFTIRVADKEFVTLADDMPANERFEGSLDQPLSFRRSIVQSDRFGGVVIGQGEIVIQNTAGDYDFLPQRYALDGREVEVRFGRVSRGAPVDDYADWYVAFKGTASGFHVDESELRVSLQDDSFRLEVPLQVNTYGGNGGIDGGEDLIGKPKPLCYGHVRNVSPPLVSPNHYLYQVHDGPVQAITAVYSRGVALTPGSNYATSALLLAASITSGQFATCLAEGMFRVNFVLDGEVTADVDGDKTGGVFVETKADIIRRIISVAGGIGDAGLYLPAFDAFADAQPAPVGLWVDHNSTDLVYDAIAKLIGVGAWAGFRRDGLFEVGQFDAPSGAPYARFDKTDIIDLRRERLPTDLSPAPWRWRVPYAQNWTVIAQPADSVSAAQRSFLAEEFRYAVSESEAIKVDHPMALERTVDGVSYRDQADAQTEANRLLDLYRRSASLYRITVGLIGMKLGIGKTIFVTYPRFDLAAGRLLRIVEINEDARARTVELLVYG